ncbi:MULTISPECIES: DMT family transporter [Paracoccaceae]|jgi:S-adenosylmethionine uptake transporter|uniref:DMT family transporter n=1 Tax=Rhodobacterales TaxID=204455 RepID=UPI001B26F2DD|nr:DMT family transporter [Boseongicola sp. H5]MBO6604931.1 DMT family transporter [Roseicyclus sp.]MBO6626750.1 DMT family transporter [Roseicyclus sp.]MBO6922669.1 DMT family transporter [Roseicyclus sp.]
MSPNLKGALFMMASMAGFTLNDACVKLLAEDLPLFQIVFLRGVATTAMMAAMVWAMGGLSFHIPRGDRGRVIWRTIAEIGAMVAFLTALINMPIANVTAILSALPLTVTLAAYVFLGEPVGWKRLLAILAGFGGVLLIVQPGGDGFSLYALAALLAVALVTARDLITRRLSRDVPSMGVAVITAAAVGLFGGVMSMGEPWRPVDLEAGILVLAASTVIIAAYLFSIMVMRVGEIGFVAPFRYTSLVWALFLGWLVFDEWPDNLTLLGSAIVVATGLFTLWREQVAAKRALRVAQPAKPAPGRC